ncbi:unnamed protein product, partial [marine sediment metagenome]
FDLEFQDDGGVLITGRGVITVDEANETSAKMNALECERHVPYELCDYSNVEKFDFLTEDVERCARIDTAVDRICPDTAVALVAPSDVAFGMARAWQILVELYEDSGITCAVFRTRAEAEEWIHLKMAQRS